MPDLDELNSMVPGPSTEDVERARMQLRRLIAADRRPVRRHRWRVAAVAVLVTAVAVTGLVVLAPTPAEAGLERIASAIEEIPVSELPAGSYHYVRIEQRTIDRFPADALPDADVAEFAVGVEATREIWVGDDGSTIVRTIVSDAAPLDQSLAGDFAASPIPDSLGVGTTTVTAYPPDPNRLPLDTLPTDPDELEAWIDRELATVEPDEHAARLLDLAAQLLANPATSPQLRAATLRVLAEVPGIETTEDDAATGVVATATAATGESVLQRSVRITTDGRIAHSTLIDLTGDPSISMAPGTVIERSGFQYASPVEDAPT